MRWSPCRRVVMKTSLQSGISLGIAFLVTAFVALPPVARADFTYTNSSGIWYYTPGIGPVTITGYSGSGGAVIMPGTINGYPVTSVGNFAFSGIHSLTS